MLVLKEGMESTQEVDYRLPEFTKIIPSEEETEEIGLEQSAEMGFMAIRLIMLDWETQVTSMPQ